MSTAEQMMTVEDVCGLLRVSRITLRRWCDGGLFPQPIKILRALRWRRSEVEDALRARGNRPVKVET